MENNNILHLRIKTYFRFLIPVVFLLFMLFPLRTYAASTEDEILRLVNQERAKVGAQPLGTNPTLHTAAVIRSQELPTRFDHTRPNGTSCFTVLDEIGVECQSAGENIACGPPNAATVVNGWMNSPGHRANILNPSFNMIGIGCIYQNGVPYYTQLFTLSHEHSFQNGSCTGCGTVQSPLEYRVHVQDIGWQEWKSDGNLSGTYNLAKRLESIEIRKGNLNVSGSIQYSTHIQDIGWQGWRADGTTSGTTGQAKRLEAIKIQLTGQLAQMYDIYYRVHAQDFGWMGWAKNGEPAGTSSYAKRLEAIEIKLIQKNGATPPPTVNGTAYRYPLVSYRVHAQDFGWLATAADGAIGGTTGQSKRLEAIQISVSNDGYGGGIEYNTHIQDIGWQGWRADNALSGTSGQSKRLEAIQIRLTGGIAEHYDVYYRVHAQDFGWMGWAKNGAQAGTAGYARRLEALQICLVPKGGAAPGSTANSFISR